MCGLVVKCLGLLSTVFVPPEISVNQLEGVVSNTNADNGLGFSDADLPSERRNHNKALHIIVECKELCCQSEL